MERPILIKGGPSPRMRAFASQDGLTFNRSAASFGVNNLIPEVGTELCGLLPVSADNCEVISNSPSVLWPVPRASISTHGEFQAPGHIDKRDPRREDFCRFRAVRLRSKRFPHASGVGERMTGSKKGSKA